MIRAERTKILGSITAASQMGAERGELNLGGLDRGESDADFLIHYSNRFLSFNSHNTQSFGAKPCLSPSPRSTLALCSIRALMKQLSAVKTSRRHSCCKNAGPRVPPKRKEKTPPAHRRADGETYVRARNTCRQPTAGAGNIPETRRGEWVFLRGREKVKCSEHVTSADSRAEDQGALN